MKTSSSILTVFAILTMAATQAQALTPSEWTADYAKALDKARVENKHVLLDFTGSDWCPWCIRLDKDVFDRGEFKSFAKDNLVPVKLDFPQAQTLMKATVEQNEKLQARFGVSAFPTLIMIDAQGKEVWRHEGYLPGGPQAFIKEARRVLKTE